MNPIRLLFSGLLILLSCSTASYSQQTYSPTPDQARISSFTARKAAKGNSVTAGIPVKNIGPTVMSGRVTDLDVNPADPTQYYVAYASGSVFKTTNNGSTFIPIFDQEATSTIGDIAVDWTRKILWVGTGESNSSRSSYAGTGVYKSLDDGKTWQHLGLADTHHIGRVILHPTNPNIAWVAAIGHLYSPNQDRGVFKTTDGGKTWKKTLFIDENTGVIDLVVDQNNPNLLYAAAWYRTRRAWNFEEAGETSGIYKSTNGGDSWVLVSTKSTGFPTGKGVGRIGLSLSGSTLYAFLDNQFPKPKTDAPADEGLTKDQLRTMSKSQFLALKKESLKQYLEKFGFPREYTAESVMEMVRRDEVKPIAMVEFLEDANQQLFDTDVIGAELYRSNDGGKSWKKTHIGYLDQVYFTYGYYFGTVWAHPKNPEKVYIAGVPILRSDDGGKTFRNINGDNVHVDHHALWVNPNRAGHLINGNDGGVNISYDDGASWFKINTPSVGQFYAVTFDMAEPYNVYGGLQDNGVWMGPSNYQLSPFEWTDDGRYPYQRLGGGDGMQVQVDFRDNNTVYFGSQFGFYSRLNRATRQSRTVRPRHKLGERPLRFNWQTPILLSRHNQDILYFGANRLFRSMDKGDTFTAISGDLTNGGKPGDVPYGTLTTIDESALQFGLLYTGSDDGLIHVSKDGGTSWQRISDGLPQNLWVSRVRASKFDKATVYVTLNGYRMDHFDAYVYVSKDYGQTWKRIGKDLPQEAVNVIVEDFTHPKLLFVGTDLGLYASLDGGESFHQMDNGLPHTPVHDLAIHPKAGDLIIGTHGRSIYLADIAQLRQLNEDILAKDLHLFAPDKVTFSERWGAKGAAWRDAFEPKVTLHVYTKTSGSATFTVKEASGKTLQTFSQSLRKGLNEVTYNLSAQAGSLSKQKAGENGVVYLPEGEYTVVASIGSVSSEGTLKVAKPEPRR